MTGLNVSHKTRRPTTHKNGKICEEVGDRVHEGGLLWIRRMKSTKRLFHKTATREQEEHWWIVTPTITSADWTDE